MRVEERERDLVYDFENLDLRFDTHLEVERERKNLIFRSHHISVILGYWELEREILGVGFRKSQFTFRYTSQGREREFHS